MQVSWVPHVDRYSDIARNTVITVTMTATIVSIVTAAVLVGGVLWKFSSITAGMQSAINHLSSAINDLKVQIGTIAAHGEKLASHEAKIDGLEHRVSRLEDKE